MVGGWFWEDKGRSETAFCQLFSHMYRLSLGKHHPIADFAVLDSYQREWDLKSRSNLKERKAIKCTKLLQIIATML